ARPDQVKKVIQSVQQQGLWATYSKVMNKLDSLTPLGYSTSGIVEAVGNGITEFKVGDRVACAGAGYANHAEVNFVPSNLAVKIPKNVDLEEAAFSTVGAISMQGFRQSNMQLGEIACVIGLGLIGQILVQILNASGIRVIGLDLDPSKCELAKKHGVEIAMHPSDDELMPTIEKATKGRGIDCIFITAGGTSNGPAELAVQIARDRGQVIVVGKTKMDLDWKDYYEKELEVKFSRSYGPGRYDQLYEEGGIDYPIGYVRWTENRNIESFLYLLDKKLICLNKLISNRFSFNNAPELYERLASGDNIGIGVLFDYRKTALETKSTVASDSQTTYIKKDLVSLAVIGVGNYASSVLIPYLRKNSAVNLHTVNTTSSLTGEGAKVKFGFQNHSTDVDSTLAEPDINSILIATRHKTHAKFVASALRANKSVFVEKPLAINQTELEEVRNAIAESGNSRLQVGFNRRFSNAIQLIANNWSSRKSILFTASYRVHAGKMDKGSWYLDASEGTRFIGEGGHFIDTLSYILEARPVSVFAQSLSHDHSTYDDFDNMSAIIKYDNGSVATLQYLTKGGNKLPKEYFELHGGGKSAVMNNFQSVQFYDNKSSKKKSLRVIDKGQKKELDEFILATKGDKSFPFSIDELFDTTLTTLAIHKSLQEARLIYLSEFWDEQA
ncbi:MAG: bi-domain-containing oxidoreductase, partial [Bacteroidota bacterium]